MASFDHSRIDDAEPYILGNAKSAMSLSYLVMDYMEHLERLKPNLTPEEQAREETSADKFVLLVDTQDAWPLAQQYAVQLASASVPNTADGNSYLNKIQLATSHRRRSREMPEREGLVRQWETQLLWNRTVDHVKFLASLSGPMTEERKTELSNTIDGLSEIFPWKSDQTEQGPTASQGESLDIGQEGPSSDNDKNLDHLREDLAQNGDDLNGDDEEDEEEETGSGKRKKSSRGPRLRGSRKNKNRNKNKNKNKSKSKSKNDKNKGKDSSSGNNNTNNDDNKRSDNSGGGRGQQSSIKSSKKDQSKPVLRCRQRVQPVRTSSRRVVVEDKDDMEDVMYVDNMQDSEDTDYVDIEDMEED